MRFAILSLVVMTLASAGCGGGGLNAVHGRVSLDGESISAGSVVFLPTAGDGTKAAAAIENGQYTVPAESGLRPGTYRVEVTWSKPTGRKIPSADPGMMMDETREAVPAKYNTASGLTADITSGENIKDFELTTN